MKKVLIIEDELIISKMYERFLTENGYRIIGKSTNISDAWTLFENHNPEIILLDLNLKKGENGLEFAVKLRAAGYKTPIIFTTGNSRKESMTKIDKISYSKFLSKPINLNELLKVMGKFKKG